MTGSPAGGRGANATDEITALDVDEFRRRVHAQTHGGLVVAIVGGFHIAGAADGMAGVDRLLASAAHRVRATLPGRPVGIVNAVTLGVVFDDPDTAAIGAAVLARRFAVGWSELRDGADGAFKLAVDRALDRLRAQFPRDWASVFSRAARDASPPALPQCGR